MKIMPSGTLKQIIRLDLEEKILNGSAILAAASVFMPWLSGEWLGSDNVVSFSGFSFYTSFLGFAIFLLQLGIVVITVVPLLGGPLLVKRRHKDSIRLLLSIQATILLLATLTVLTHITFDFAKMEVRYGIYIALITSLITLFEITVHYLGHRKMELQEVFHHPEETIDRERMEHMEHKEPLRYVPPPPPPPAPSEPEDHRRYP
ncbi:MAG: hypothetical protein JWM56_125 [Candidatus Peribacteria bacterium]|nr:hypothetical protein [Candidatus Peribacteria bacterium]